MDEPIRDQYTNQAEFYAKLKTRDWVRVIEVPTVIAALGDLQDVTCMDMACGSGFYTRQMKLLGARDVIGVDYSPPMIEIAREAEENERLGIKYLVHDCEHLEQLNMPEYFDVIFGGWMVPYIPTVERVEAFARGMRLLLKKGGRTIQLFGNENRFVNGKISDLMEAMGQRFEARRRSIEDGDPYQVVIGSIDDHPDVNLTNHYYSHETIERCFLSAGFKTCKFHPIVLKTTLAAERAKYQNFVDDPLITVFEAVN